MTRQACCHDYDFWIICHLIISKRVADLPFSVLASVVPFFGFRRSAPFRSISSLSPQNVSDQVGDMYSKKPRAFTPLLVRMIFSSLGSLVSLLCCPSLFMAFIPPWKGRLAHARRNEVRMPAYAVVCNRHSAQVGGKNIFVKIDGSQGYASDDLAFRPHAPRAPIVGDGMALSQSNLLALTAFDSDTCLYASVP